MTPRWSVFKVLQVLYENIALEGRNGISVRSLFEKYEPSGDVLMQASIWAILRRGCSPTNPVQVAHNVQINVKDETDDLLPSPFAVMSKKRKAVPTKPGAKAKKAKTPRKKMSSSDSDSDNNVDIKSQVSRPSSVPLSSSKSAAAASTTLPQHDLIPVHDAASMSFDMAMADATLVLVANYDIRLQALGYAKVGVDINVHLLDVLEMIGRARCIGITVSHISRVLFDDDIKRMHYFLDELVNMNLVEKRILTLPPRRFNIIHLKRFASQFDPHTMGFAGFHYAHEPHTKTILVNKLVRSMQLRHEETAVFADVAKRFDLHKRQQESLRNHICMESSKHPQTFPLHMFMATCRGGERSTGRKLWCVRVADPAATSRPALIKGGTEFAFPLQTTMGAAEYLYRLVEAASPEGISIPEIKDICGNPDNKWVYKKMQHMLIHHKIASQKIMGDRGVIHNFSVAPTVQPGAAPFVSNGVGVGRYSSLRQSIKNSGHSLVGDVFLERQAFLVDQIKALSIVSVGLLRRTLCAHENRRGTHGIDGRTIMRLLQPLIDAKSVEYVDVNVPWKKTAGHTRVRCAALPFVMQEESQATLRRFLDQYSPLDDMDSTTKWTDATFSIVREDHLRMHSAADKKGGGKGGSMGKIVSYSHNLTEFHSIRQKLRDQHRQCRRIGQAYGMICRVRLLHVAICRALVRLKLWPPPSTVQSGGGTDDDEPAPVEFSFQDVMAHTSVKDYCQIFGPPEPLSEADETLVKQMIYAANTMPAPEQWQKLGDVGKMLQRNQQNRAMRLVEIMMDFKLVTQLPSAPLQHESVYSSNVDEMVSRVVDQTVHGGVLKLNLHVYVAVVDERASTPLRIRGELKPMGFSPLPTIPLHHSFQSVADVEAFWRLLEIFYLEGARWECVADPPMPDLPPMHVKPYLVPSVNATLALLWTDSGSLQRQRIGILKTRAKPKKRAFSTHLINPNPKWKVEGRGQQIKMRRQLPLRIKPPRRKAEKIDLTPDQEQAALESYLDKIVQHWTIKDMPTELRFFPEEDSVFVNSRVKRGRVNWNAIGLEVAWPLQLVGRTRPYVGLEVKRRLVKSFLPRPSVKKHLVELEMAQVAAKNPTGRFLEEAVIHSDARAYGCLVKAVQMMLQPDADYDAAVADDLLGAFSTLEMQLVWRYLYLPGKINKSKPADTGHRRGFSFSLAMFDFLRLNATQWPLTMCLDAAEHLGGMSTLREDGMEMQMPSNASSGFMATLMAAHVRGTADLAMAFERTKDEVFNGMTKGYDGRRYKCAGFIGHMHRFTDGLTYDEFNMHWVLSTKPTMTKVGGEAECLEAFTCRKRSRRDVEWTCPHDNQPTACTSVKRCRTKVDHALVKAIDATHDKGLSVTELMAALFPHTSTPRRRRQQLQEQLDQLVADDRVCDVHAFDCVRYVATEHAKPWFVYPFTKDATTNAIEFQRDAPVMARPWLKMDGEVNDQFLVVVKRELTMLVVGRPGIGEQRMCEYFKGLLGLQDVRNLCFQLIDERVLYCRAIERRKQCGLFGGSNASEAPVVGEYSMDRHEMEMHYFPAVDCFGELGNAVQEML
ncbi:hypothetical protein DYB35_000099 [Aphanomyces astaci]|uniref:B-block binding subunit of TFIIIC domain-containing protein n=4 Tax=Aphanomyces astaci TaxID=112090 RepID=A0A418DQY5_APHAT|nr:hypothetical protein DYB35_000099 [Aphanomyces astaci]